MADDHLGDLGLDLRISRPKLLGPRFHRPGRGSDHRDCPRSLVFPIVSEPRAPQLDQKGQRTEGKGQTKRKTNQEEAPCIARTSYPLFLASFSSSLSSVLCPLPLAIPPGQDSQSRGAELT